MIKSWQIYKVLKCVLMDITRTHYDTEDDVPGVYAQNLDKYLDIGEQDE